MKIRMDYVTNSSSVSYATATIQALQQMLLLGGLFGLSSVYGSPDTNGTDGSMPQMPEMMPGAPDRDIDWDEFLYSNLSYDDKITKIEQELLNFQAEWDSVKDGIAMEDFEQTQGDYQAYFDYLNGLKDSCADIEDQKEWEQAMNDFDAQYAEDWADHRKDDIVNVKNDIADMQATIAGYQANGLDTKELEAQLAMLQGYEKDLTDMIDDAGIDFSYTAQSVDPIDPPPELIAIQQAHDQKMQALLAQAQANEERKAEIRAEMIQNALDYQKELENAGFWGKAEFIAQVLSGTADMAIDVLAYLTGPAGQIVKIKYNMAKDLGTTFTDVAWDPDNASKHLLKGSIKITTDLVKEKLPDGNMKKFYEYGLDMTNNMSGTVIDEVSKAPKGETAEQRYQRIQTAAIHTSVKTTVNTGIKELSSYITPKKDNGSFYEYDDYNAKTFDQATRYGVKSFGEALDEGASNAAKDFVTGQISKETQSTYDKVNQAIDKAKKGAKK